MSLLADWPTAGHVITADLLSCSANEHLPYALNLLITLQSRQMSSNVPKVFIIYQRSNATFFYLSK